MRWALCIFLPVWAAVGGWSAEGGPSVPPRATLKVSGMTPAPGSTVTTTLTEVTVDLDAAADDLSISSHSVTLVGDGVDDLFGTPDDVTITPDSITLVGGTQVTIDLTSAPLANDTYRVTLSGTADVTSGLVGHWELDDATGTTAVDSSTAANDGNITGPTWTTGRIKDGLNFAGGTDTVTTSAAGVAPPWSAAMWVKRTDSSAPESRLLDSDAFPTGGSLRLEQYYGTDKVGVTDYNIKHGVFDATVPVGEWVHLTFVGDGTDVRLYVDGTLTDTVAIDIDVPRFHLGTQDDNSLNGDLDDVRVYDRELTDDEIGSLAALAGAVRDTIGNLLDGEYTASFPTGDDVDGGDFVADFTVDVTPPGDPTALTATAVGTTSIDLVWTDNATNEEEVIIDRSLDGITFAELTRVAADSTVHTDLGLCPATTYYYRVRATNTGGDSANSNVDSDTTGVVAATIAVTNMVPAPGAVLETRPSELLATLSASVDAATVTRDTVTLVRAGDDGAVGTADDVSIDPVSVTVVGGSLIRLELDSSGLPNDLYRVTLSGTTGPTTNLIHWWKLDEGSGAAISDATASALHGTISGPTWTAGRLGQGLSFAGGTDRVSLSGTDLAAPWTLSLWVMRTDSGATDACILDSQSDLAGGSIRLEQFNNTNHVGVTEYGTADRASGYAAPASAWVHLAFVCDGTATDLYVDGVLTDTLGLTFDLSRYYLGSHGSTSMEGLLDELMVFDDVLMETRIRELAALGGAIRGSDGVILDGEFGGTFASGNGTAGGSFQATFRIDVFSIADPSLENDSSRSRGSGPSGSGNMGADYAVQVRAPSGAGWIILLLVVAVGAGLRLRTVRVPRSCTSGRTTDPGLIRSLTVHVPIRI